MLASTIRCTYLSISTTNAQSVASSGRHLRGRSHHVDVEMNAGHTSWIGVSGVPPRCVFCATRPATAKIFRAYWRLHSACRSSISEMPAESHVHYGMRSQHEKKNPAPKGMPNSVFMALADYEGGCCALSEPMIIAVSMYRALISSLVVSSF